MPATPFVNDILDHIVSRIAAELYLSTPEPPRFEWDDSGSDAARQALARLARAHGTFTQPALAALWRYLPSDEPLKHLICVVGIAQRPRHDEDEWITPSMVCGFIFVGLIATFTFLTGAFWTARHPPIELGTISGIRLSCAGKHYRPIRPQSPVPRETSTRHLLVAGVMRTRRHTHPSSLGNRHPLQPKPLRSIRLRHERRVVPSPSVPT